MHLRRLVIGELVLLLASVLIFRSLWHMLDQYLGDAYLPVFLIVGLVLFTLALILIHKENNAK
jgi:hypothetical protein